jgi:excisionase family DNA binding protein
MNKIATKHEVLTLPEAARFLRVKKALLEKLVQDGTVPARKVGDDWRFSRTALQAWLSGRPDYRKALMEQAGAFADDETLPELLKSIYDARGRPEVEPEE